MKKLTKRSALSGLRKPHRNSLPGPVNDTTKQITELTMSILASVFIN